MRLPAHKGFLKPRTQKYSVKGSQELSIHLDIIARANNTLHEADTRQSFSKRQTKYLLSSTYITDLTKSTLIGPIKLTIKLPG